MISQTGEYALRAAVFLARHGVDATVSAQQIAERTRIPVGYLQKILRQLSRAHLLSSQRGSGGGFALAKVPSAISVLDVLRAVDADIQRISRCPLGIKGHQKLCRLHRLLDEQYAQAERIFGSTSLLALAEELEDDEAGCRGVIPAPTVTRPG
ncbi:MAG: Rrf2 family transcriptional regulator [Phycisphaeraceae bacterium]|nr:Rrf2 family transcriptional regulator [Phycisphaerales bacterium]MCB1957132.1 Rrf2 family transcriptional regulator [Rhodocyclaceae bacterium]MCB9842295.1 Rrf2 family transcriptional regulator [Phycisphaeraceae bacterium]